ncbi:alpha/beta hydrolase [bacterium]|nr:MAG: alpha/beta hydrolase [bacterium]
MSWAAPSSNSQSEGLFCWRFSNEVNTLLTNHQGGPMACFVLVHGTGSGGWCWKKVAQLLRTGGNEVYTPTLSGVGDRSHLLKCGIDLSTHITDVANLLFFEDLENVVLVGHSYAGMVITGVAARVPERLKFLVYLDAYVPEEGETERDLWPAKMRAEIEGDEAAGKGLRAPPSPAFLGIIDPGLAEWYLARVTAHPMATYDEPAPRGNAQGAALPRMFIHCTQGPTAPVFAPFAEKARSRGWPYHEIATGHEAMLIAPDQVAAILLGVH